MPKGLRIVLGALAAWGVVLGLGLWWWLSAPLGDAPASPSDSAEIGPKPVEPPAEMVTVSGVITDAESRPFPHGVLVTKRHPDGSIWREAGRADADGRYEVLAPLGGRITLAHHPSTPGEAEVAGPADAVDFLLDHAWCRRRFRIREGANSGALEVRGRYRMEPALGVIDGQAGGEVITPCRIRSLIIAGPPGVALEAGVPVAEAHFFYKPYLVQVPETDSDTWLRLLPARPYAAEVTYDGRPVVGAAVGPMAVLPGWQTFTDGEGRATWWLPEQEGADQATVGRDGFQMAVAPRFEHSLWVGWIEGLFGPLRNRVRGRWVAGGEVPVWEVSLMATRHVEVRCQLPGGCRGVEVSAGLPNEGWMDAMSGCRRGTVQRCELPWGREGVVWAAGAEAVVGPSQDVVTLPFDQPATVRVSDLPEGTGWRMERSFDRNPWKHLLGGPDRQPATRSAWAEDGRAELVHMDPGTWEGVVFDKDGNHITEPVTVVVTQDDLVIRPGPPIEDPDP